MTEKQPVQNTIRAEKKIAFLPGIKSSYNNCRVFRGLGVKMSGPDGETYHGIQNIFHGSDNGVHCRVG